MRGSSGILPVPALFELNRSNAVLWIRIRILIRIEFGRLDPDPGGQKLPTKSGKNLKISCFEVLDVLFKDRRFLL